MAEIPTIHIAEDGEHVAFGVPFSKVNVKDRTVEGFATLDNIDKASDIVDFEASKEAFGAWMGNIREMHGPKAVGKAVQIEERVLEKDGQRHRGIWVKSRISKGAEDTWQKIIDGTLAGYSIGGRVLERRPEVVKTSGSRYSEQRVNRIVKYMLGELSVVDNPMNPLSLFDGISKGLLIKMDGDEMVAGDLVAHLKGLFYCENCNVAKMDSLDFTEIECPTCDNQAVKIGDVAEAPDAEGLKKMVDNFNLQKADIAPHTFKPGDGGKCAVCGQASNAPIHTAYQKVDEPEEQKVLNYTYLDYNEYDGESGFGVSGEWKPNPELQDAKPDLLQQVAEATPQSDNAAPHAEKSAQVAPKAEVPTIDADSLAEKIAEVLKSRVEFTGRSTKDKQDPEKEFLYGLLDADVLKTRKAYSVKAAALRFNFPGERVRNGYSMTEWAELGKSIARNLGEGHEFTKGYVTGPSISEEDTQKSELIFNLQKNTTDDNNNIVKLLQNLVGYLQEDDSSITKGGETQTLDLKGLDKIYEILETATKEVGEVLKGFNVERLNSEAGTGASVGTSGGDPGVGAEGSAGAGTAMTVGDVEVAKPASLASPDAGPDKVVPDAIETDGTGIAQGITSDSGPEKVLPHAVLKAEGVEADTPTTETAEDPTQELLKGFMTKLEGAFEKINERLDVVENSGAGKKSAEVGAELKKSDSGASLWGGTFYSGELTDK